MWARFLANMPEGTLIVIAVSALFLTLIAGLFLSLGAVLGVLVFGIAAARPSPSAFLLLVAIVLLIVVIVLLLMLLVCSGCFTKGREDKAALARLLQYVPLFGALSQLRPAVEALEKALGSVSTTLGTVATTLNDAHTAVETALPTSFSVPSFETKPITSVVPGGTLLGDPTGIDVITGLEWSDVSISYDVLDLSVGSIQSASDDLAAATSALATLKQSLPQSP